MSVNAELKAAIVDYAKTWPVFDGYRATKYSKKYLSGHEAEIAVYRAARATFQRVLSGVKFLKMDALKEEYQKLAATKREAVSFQVKTENPSDYLCFLRYDNLRKTPKRVQSPKILMSSIRQSPNRSGYLSKRNCTPSGNKKHAANFQ